MSKSKEAIQRLPAEQLYAHELEQLGKEDAGAPKPGAGVCRRNRWWRSCSAI